MLLLLCDIICTDGSWRKKESTKRREEPLDTSFEYSSSSFSARLRDPLLITFLLATKGGDFSRCCCCCCIFWHSVLFLHFFSLLCIVSACASSTLADCTAPTFDSFCYLPYHQFENHLEETTTRRRNKRGRRARQQRRRNDNNKKERDRERPREGSAGLHLLSTLTRYDDPLWLCAVCVCVCVYIGCDPAVVLWRIFAFDPSAHQFHVPSLRLADWLLTERRVVCAVSIRLISQRRSSCLSHLSFDVRPDLPLTASHAIAVPYPPPCIHIQRQQERDSLSLLSLVAAGWMEEEEHIGRKTQQQQKSRLPHYRRPIFGTIPNRHRSAAISDLLPSFLPSFLLL